MNNIKLIGINSKFIHTNTATWYLFYSLKKNNISSEVLSYTINDKYLDVLKDILSDKPDIVCFSCYIWNINFVLTLVEDIKKIDNKIKIILGGPEVSFNSEELLRNNNIDLIIRGEGENIITNIINGDYSMGCAYISNNKYIDTGYNIISELNDIPFIFTPKMLEKEKNKIIYYESSRGCPYNCIYCLSSTLKGVRYLELDRVIEELNTLINYNIKQIKFVDRTFNLNDQRTLALLDYIKNIKNDINFHLEIYPASLSEKVIDKLLEMPSGRIQIEAGIQSTNKKTLDKSLRYQDVKKALINSKRIIENNNIHVHLDLIAGLPYEDKQSFIKSFNETIKVQPHMLQLGFLKLLKGTKINDINGYVSQGYAPYEILKTKWLSFEDIGEIKEVENVVDTFYNTNKFVNTISHMMSKTENYYSIFLALSNKIKKDFDNKKLSENDKYKILYEFNLKKNIIKELLRFDYMATHSSKNIPNFINSEEKLKEKLFTYFKSIDKNGKVEYKNTNVSTFCFNKKETYLFDYRIKDKVNKIFQHTKIKI